MRITSLLVNPDVELLMPPVRLYRMTILSLAILSWSAVIASLWYGWGAMELLHWVGVIFGGSVGLLVLQPRSWHSWRLAELAWDDKNIYLLNGQKNEAVVIERRHLVALESTKRVGYNGQWFSFTLDLRLGEEQLAAIVAIWQLKEGEIPMVSPGVYRFGFNSAWHRRQTLHSRLSTLSCAESDKNA